jgi:hypothetical protein
MERRDFLKWVAGGGAAALGLSANQVNMYRAELWAVYELLKYAEPIRHASILDTRLKISGTPEPHLLDSIGDSQLADPPVMAEFIKRQLEKRGNKWEVRNYAEHGKTTDDVLREQLKQKDLLPGGERGSERFLLLVHSGGNDLQRQLARTQDDMSKLKNFSRFLGVNSVESFIETIKAHPETLSAFPDALSLLRTGDSAVSQVGRRVVNLLEKADDTYGSRILGKVVILTSDYSQCKQIGFTDGVPSLQMYNFEPFKRIAQNLSGTLHDNLITALNSYKDPTGNPVLAIETFNFKRGDFGDDEHWSPDGKRKIAKAVADHITYYNADTRGRPR